MIKIRQLFTKIRERGKDMDSINDLWTLVQDEIKNNVSEVLYEVWLSSLELYSFDGTVATVTTDGFRMKIIKQKFMENIKSAFEKVTGFDVEIEFVEAQPEAEETVKKTVEYDTEDEDQNTFETFVVGSSNRFAHAAAVAVAEKPGATANYNPLFIYGNSGLGKTHLLRAIGHEIQKNNPDASIITTRGEDFVNLIISGIRDHQMQAIHDKYRNADVLLVDDIQFIGGKDSTQEEFFHTFDALINDNKQIVLTSDRPPKEIKILDERLRTRFEWGLLADIQPPDLETRMAIIHRKAQRLDIELPNDVVLYIAENIRNNVRQLEGAVKKLKAFSTIHGSAIDISTAQTAIKDILTDSAPAPVTVEKIINEVARTHGANPEDIRSKKKDSKTASMRQIAIYVARKLTNLSSTDIGLEFGGRDHSTVLHSIEVVQKRMETDSALRAMIEDIEKNVSE